MARETKVGLLVGLCVILLIGIIVSDHLSVAQHQSPAPLIAISPTVNDGLNQTMPTGVADRSPTPEAADRFSSPPAPIPGPNDPRPTDVGQQPIRVPNTPDPAVVNPGTHTTPGALGDTQMVNGRQPQPTNPAVNAVPAIQVLDTHTVQHGDTLYKLAKTYYRNPEKWTAISQANPTVIGPGGKLKDGTALIIPKLPDTGAPANAPQVALVPPTTPNPVVAPPVASRPNPANTSSARLIQVQPNDTLAMLATRYLGSRDRWHDILDINRDQLQRPEDLRIGMKLRLPDVHSAIAPPNTTMLALRPAPGTPNPGNVQALAGNRVTNANTGTPFRMVNATGTPGTPGAPSPAAGMGTPVAARTTTHVPLATNDRPGAPWPLGGGAPANPVRPATQQQITYTVQANDSLEDIAARTLGDPHKWPVIINANRAALAGQDHLQIGQRLVIPVSPGR